MSATDVAAWAALFLALGLVVFLVGLAVIVARFWRKVEPSVAPLLTMFGGVTTSTASTAPALDVHEHDGGSS